MNKEPVQMLDGIYMMEVPLLTSFLEREETPTTLSYLVKTGDGWLMVDTGYNDKGAFDALCQQLDTLGISMKDIRWLFLTHYHPDHSGLALRVREASEAKVILHQDDWNLLRNAVGSDEEWTLDGLVEWAKSLGVPQEVLERFYTMATFGRALFPKGLEPDIVLRGEENPVAGEEHLRAILTPGHSPGHICLYDTKNKVLFSGDHVLVGITPHISPSHLTSYNQLGQYLDSLRKVRPLEVDLVLPAHERPFTYLAQRVDEILEHHRERLEEMISALSGHPSTPWEVAGEVHWDVGSWKEMEAANRVLAVRETLAHLQFLESRGQVVMVESDGLNLYKLANSSAA